ncbi:MAG: hypothetical protein IKU29_02070 [Parabacteroides sp.]|nr:hypothetical protein [Parabacteroides sp.]
MDVIHFMSGQFEKNINEKMMYYDYVFPTGEVLEYVDAVCETPIDRILEYIVQMDSIEITAHDVFQFSSFEDASIRMCIEMQKTDNPGMNHLEVGKMLLNDGKERNEGAYLKYGENHAKTGTAIGLLYELCRTYFLSCIGMVYPQIPEEQRNRLLTRLILRSPFVSRVIKATQNGNVQMRQFLYMLSYSTYVRRRSNIKAVFSIVSDSVEFDFSEVVKKISFND